MTVHQTIESLVAAQMAKPITHHVVTAWSDGQIDTHPTSSASAAENWATGERRKVGREVTRRKFPNGRAHVISVEVVTL